MDKQMIEEMAKVEIGAILEKVNMGDGYADIDSLADEIYHIAIPYGAVVLTREQYAKLQALKGDYVKGYEAGVEEGWDNARKESIDEFVAKVKSRMEPLIEQARDMAARNHRHGFTIMACMWRSEMVAMLTDIEVLEQVANEMKGVEENDSSKCD